MSSRGAWRACAAVFAAVLAVCMCGSANAQVGWPSGGPVRATVLSPDDAMRAFFKALRDGDTYTASRYLDVPEGSQPRAEELAQRLGVVLTQELGESLQNISALPTGNLEDGLAADLEQLGVLETEGGDQPVRMRHLMSPTFSWIFTQGTVGNIDAWYERIPFHPVLEHLPLELLATSAFGLARWQLLALCSAAIVLTLLTALIVTLLRRPRRSMDAIADNGEQRLRMSCIVSLSHATTTSQMQDVLDALRAVLREHPKIEPETSLVHFTTLGAASLDVEVAAWCYARDAAAFQAVRQSILMQFMEAVAKAGTSLTAAPHQEPLHEMTVLHQ